MKCPHCFRVLPAQIQLYSCHVCPTVTSAEVADRNGGIDLERQYAFPASSARCPNCNTLAAEEACPECWGVIPQIWRHHPDPIVTCVAMVGSRSSGKSLYIAVAQRQLEFFVEKRIRSYLAPLLGSAEAWFERYGKRVYEEGLVLDPTVEVVKNLRIMEPLAWTFTDQNGRTRILVLRDVAGEDLEAIHDHERRQRLEFLRRADALIMLQDPRGIPELADAMAAVAAPDDEIGADGVGLLQNLVTFLQAENPGQKTRVRIAVTLSQADRLDLFRNELSEYRGLVSRPGSPLMRDPSMSFIAIPDRDLMNQEMDSFLQRLLGGGIRNILNQGVEQSRYFAVSALGADPVAKQLDAAGIMPFRVLDPLKWAMGL